MPIKYQYGEGEVRALATAAGKAQAAQQAVQNRLQKDMALMDYQFRLEAAKRSRLWELEKMEIASRMDFQRSEQMRQSQLQERELRLKKINEAVESGIITPETGAELSLAANLEIAGAGRTAATVTQEDSSGFAQYLQGVGLGGETVEEQVPGQRPATEGLGVGPQPTTTVGKIIGKSYDPQTGGTYYVEDQDGRIEDVAPTSQVKAINSRGELVIVPMYEAAGNPKEYTIVSVDPSIVAQDLAQLEKQMKRKGPQKTTAQSLIFRRYGH